MEAIGRACLMYFFLLIVIRISGKRTLAEITIFDFILILVIGDATQQAMTGPDYSLINAFIVIATLIILDSILTYIKTKFKKFGTIVDGSPLIILKEGECIKRNLEACGIVETDVLEAARKIHGIERFEQIKYAILEKDGNISIIPFSNNIKS